MVRFTPPRQPAIASRVPLEAIVIVVIVLLTSVVVLLTGRLGHVARLQRERTRSRALMTGVPAPATDPALLSYREMSAWSCTLHDPRGIAIGPGAAIYVAGDRVVVRLARDQAPTTVAVLASSPTCLAVLPDGALAVGCGDHLEIWRARQLVARGARQHSRSYLTALAVHGETLWAADAGARVIWRYTRAGRCLGMLARQDAVRRMLVVPSPHLDIVAGADGSLWVANPGEHRLEQYAADGRLLRQWSKGLLGNDGFAGCCNPADIAMLPDGNLVTSEKGLPRVKEYRTDGSLVGFVAGPEAFPGSTAAHDIAVDASGQVYILDAAAQTVRVFRRKAQAHHE